MAATQPVSAIMDVLRRHCDLLILFAMLQLGDIVSTHLALKSGFQEGNPLPSIMLVATGEAGMYALKLIAAVLFLIVIYRLEGRFTNPWWAVKVMNIIMVMVVVSNSLALAL